MPTQHLTIPKISCGHCTRRIETALTELPGVIAVTAEISTKAVAIEWDETVIAWDVIAATLEHIGYPPDR